MKTRCLGLLAGLLCVGACGSDSDGTTREPATGAAGTVAGGSSAGSLAAAGTVAGTAGTGAGSAGRGVAGGAGVTGPGTAGFGSAGRAGAPVPPPAGRGAPPVGGMMAVAGAPAAGSGAAGAAGATPVGDRTGESVCARWKMDRANLSEGTWSGNVAACDAGDISAEGRANALRSINLYRWLADMPAVVTDPTMDKQAQACALLQRANNTLSHTPPMTWTCYNAEGAMAAGRCNISTGAGVASVDGYMVDPGNPTTIGHRRWILSNSFGPTGLGSTDRHSCMMTAGKMKVGRPWMAWPSPGIIPLQAMQGGFGQKVDSTGWTIQSDTINLANAQVTVTVDGAPQPVTVTQLLPGYGSRYAIRFNPMGWSTTAGKTYAIAVTGAAMPINYSVQIVDCR